MRKRQKMSKRASKRVFRNTSLRTHTRNLNSPVMRGGIRL
jgi:hypothetical protein